MMVTVVNWTYYFLKGDIFRDMYITLLASQLTTKTGEEVNANYIFIPKNILSH